MNITDSGPFGIQCVGREIRLCHTVTTADGETTDVCRVLTPDQALQLAKRLMIEALGR
jgi:hypothetical protein